MTSAVRNAGFNCQVHDKKFTENEICFWVLMSPVVGHVFAKTKAGGTRAVDLRKLLDSTEHQCTANLGIKVDLKEKATKEGDGETTSYTLGFILVRAHIMMANLEIEGPQIITTTRSQGSIADIPDRDNDVADDQLATLFSQLGI